MRRIHFPVVHTAVLLITTGLFSGCCAARRAVNYPPSPLMTPATSGPLVEVAEKAQQDVPNEHSRFFLIDRNLDALNIRIALIHQAKESIDLQYFIWENDETGLLLMMHLFDAVQRGVRVRVLVDDMPIGGSDSNRAALAQYPGMDLRIFNPGRIRKTPLLPSVEWIIDFGRLNHRMHNKAMVVDGTWAVMGGRNIGNPYFGFSKKYNFRDLDVVTTGPIVRDVADAFQLFWESPYSFPAAAFRKPYTEAQLAEKLAEAREEAAENEPFFDGSGILSPEASWDAFSVRYLSEAVEGEAHFVQDDPDIGAKDLDRTMVDTLTMLGDILEQEAVLVTPYLVTRRSSLERMAKRREEGLDIDVLVPSLAANNHTIVHGHYRKNRERYLDAGVELYEFDHQPNPEIRELADSDPVKAEFVSLHMKAVVGDRRYVILGSVNLDPRALEINTENGLLIDSPELAAKVLKKVEAMIQPGNAWKLQYRKTGEIYWSSGEEELNRQPARGSWQRVKDSFLGILPIEGQL